MLNTYQVSLLCLLVIFFVSSSDGFYLPGVAMEEYTPNHKPIIKVNKLTSTYTQIPFKYYYLPFCAPPKKELHEKDENIGEVLRGDKIEDSVYEISPKVDVDCRAINNLNTVGNQYRCSNYTQKDINKFYSFIKDNYEAQWILDNLPAATVLYGSPEKRYSIGFKIGETSQFPEGPAKLYNHLDIKVIYNDKGAKEASGVYIIGFEVLPSSRNYDSTNWAGSTQGECPPFDDELYITQNEDMDTQTNIVWTYSVKWEMSDTPWVKRWGVYLQGTGYQIHWISIVNSLLIVLFLSGMISLVMKRTLRKELRGYDQIEQADTNKQEETGWESLHGDVFRPPRYPMALAVLIGTGVQLFGMTLVTLLFAVLGFLSPAQRGYLMKALLVLFGVMGFCAGYFSTRCYRMFKGSDIRRNTIITALAFPGTIFVIYFILNMFLRAVHSSGALPFSSFVTLIAMWYGINGPLVFVGSYIAKHKSLPEDPAPTNQTPRPIPEQVWYGRPLLSVFVGGLLPFGVVFIEFFFILLALWGNHTYYIFGFLVIVFILLVITIAELTVLMCYYQLCAQDYNWWWRSFLTGGASAFYVFCYATFYFVTNLRIENFVGGLLYFGYTLIITIAFFVLTGTIGFYACLFFVRRTYRNAFYQELSAFQKETEQIKGKEMDVL